MAAIYARFPRPAIGLKSSGGRFACNAMSSATNRARRPFPSRNGCTRINSACTSARLLATAAPFVCVHGVCRRNGPRSSLRPTGKSALTRDGGARIYLLRKSDGRVHIAPAQPPEPSPRLETQLQPYHARGRFREDSAARVRATLARIELQVRRLRICVLSSGSDVSYDWRRVA